MSASRCLPVMGLLLLAACQSGPRRGLPQPSALERRAARSLAEDRPEEARQIFLQAVRTARDPFISTVGLARCALALGDGRGFDRLMQAAMASASPTPEVHDLLGRTFLEAARAARGGGRRVQYASTAAAFFGQALRGAPELPGLVYHLGVAWLLAGRDDRAAAVLTSAHTIAPESVEVTEALALALRRLGRSGEVLRLLKPLDETGRLPGSLQQVLLWAREKHAAPSSGTRAAGKG